MTIILLLLLGKIIFIINQMKYHLHLSSFINGNCQVTGTAKLFFNDNYNLFDYNKKYHNVLSHF